MFDLMRPCVNCPFRRGVGETFQLDARRIAEIVAAPAFQCHKTVDYDGPEDDEGYATTRPGDRPQQCAGLMAVLHRENRLNQIMQVAERLGVLDCSKLDPRGEAYGSLAEVLEAHAG